MVNLRAWWQRYFFFYLWFANDNTETQGSASSSIANSGKGKVGREDHCHTLFACLREVPVHVGEAIHTNVTPGPTSSSFPFFSKSPHTFWVQTSMQWWLLVAGWGSLHPPWNGDFPRGEGNGDLPWSTPIHHLTTWNHSWTLNCKVKSH